MPILSALERNVQRFFYLLLTLASVGTLLLFFEADFIQRKLFPNLVPKTSHTSFFVTQGICVVLFMLSTVPNYFIPSSHRGALRKFTAVLFANGIDICICLADSLVELSPANEKEKMQARAARAGALMVLIASFLALLAAFVIPKKPLRETFPKMLSLKGLVALLCVLFLCAGQACIWAIKDNCNADLYPSSTHLYIHNASPWFFALLIFTANIQDDAGTQDMGYFFMVHYLVSTAPVFSKALETYDNRVKLLARLELGFLFGAAVLYVLGLLFIRFRQSRATAGMRPPLGSYDVVGQIFLSLFSLAGAVLVYTQAHLGPDGNGLKDGDTYFATLSIYYATLAMFIPVLNLLAALADFRLASTTAVLLSFNLGPVLCSTVSNSEQDPFTPESFYRAGFILLLISLVVSPILVYVRLPGQPVDSFLVDMPMPRSPRSKRATPMMVFWLWLLDAAYLWKDNTTLAADTQLPHYVFSSVLLIGVFSFLAQHDNDVQRAVYFAALYDVTNPTLWPIAPALTAVAEPTIAKTLLLILGLWFVTVYSWDTPSAKFDALHEVYELTLSNNRFKDSERYGGAGGGLEGEGRRTTADERDAGLLGFGTTADRGYARYDSPTSYQQGNGEANNYGHGVAANGPYGGSAFEDEDPIFTVAEDKNDRGVARDERSSLEGPKRANSINAASNVSAEENERSLLLPRDNSLEKQ